VLAIAALIFLMVFIALPALQRNQRDQARKEVLGKVTSAVTTYQSNKRSAQPGSGFALAGYVDGTTATKVSGEHNKAFTSDPLADTLIDSNYVLHVTKFVSPGIGQADTNIVQVLTGATCDPTGSTAITGSARNAAVIIVMENGLNATALATSSICQSI